jgi:hypothetical protein
MGEPTAKWPNSHPGPSNKIHVFVARLMT